MRSDADQFAVASHESGHAVAALAFGYYALYAFIRADGSGLASYMSVPSGDAFTDYERHGIIFCAGNAAQQMIHRSERGDSIDQQHVEHFAAKFPYSLFHMKCRWMGFAHELVHARRDSIFDLAAAIFTSPDGIGVRGHDAIAAAAGRVEPWHFEPYTKRGLMAAGREPPGGWWAYL